MNSSAFKEPEIIRFEEFLLKKLIFTVMLYWRALIDAAVVGVA